MAADRPRAQAGCTAWRRVAGFLLELTVAAGQTLITPGAGKPRAPARERTAAPAPRVSRVTPPEATGAVEVLVAMNPTDVNHLIAVSIARLKGHPGVTDFAYVTIDAGRGQRQRREKYPHRSILFQGTAAVSGQGERI